MVNHIVIFTWVEGTSPAQIDAFAQALTALAVQVKDITTIQHGRDLHFREGNGDYALLARFAGKAGWDEYQAHPAHKAFVRDHVAPLQARRLAIQF